MNICFINLFRKTIYIIFIGLLLSIISSKESLSSEQVFTIQNLEISKLKSIDQIILNLQNKYIFSDSQIKEKFDNCYYIK